MNVKTIITDELYDKFIEYVSTKCDAVMFVFNKQCFDNNRITLMEERKEKIKEQLEGNLLKSRNGACWVYSKRGNKACSSDMTPDHPNYELYLNAGLLADPPGFDDLFEIDFLNLTLKQKVF